MVEYSLKRNLSEEKWLVLPSGDEKEEGEDDKKGKATNCCCDDD